MSYYVRRGVRRGVGIVLAIVLSAALVSCSSSGEDKPDSDNQTSSNVPDVSASPWGKTLAKVKPDGSVDTATALSAFVQAIGPIPGVESPGPSDDIYSGTIAIRWVTRVWSELTEEQQRAIQDTLNGVTSQAAGFRSVSYRSVSDPKPLPLDPKGPHVRCQTKDSDGAGPYRALVDDIVTKITKRLGRGLQHPISIAVDTKAGSSATRMDAVACVDPEVADGPGRGCTLHVSANADLDPSKSPNISSALAREVMHCFVFDRIGLKSSVLPDWFAEGMPTWVDSDLGPVGGATNFYWRKYLYTADSSLSKRTYDGIGFFVHLAETGTNPWRVIDKMAVAMSDGRGTAAGWNAAGVSTPFLDSWGSGYVQGADGMTSRAWSTTGPNLSTYRPDIEPAAVEVVDGESLTVKAPAEGTTPVLAKVGAEAVQVRPDTSAVGRISLGSGKDATLSTAAVATYCTLGADECRCPIDSDGEGTRFTPMEKGSQYVTVAGGLGGAGVTVAGKSLDDFCGETSPLVGTWRSQSTRINSEFTGLVRYLVTGGAGVVMTIRKDETVTVNYNGMKPASTQMAYIIGPGFKATGTISVSGTERGTLDLTRARVRAGAWEPEDVKLDIVANTVMDKGGVLPGPSSFIGPMLPGTWKITGEAGLNTRQTLTVVGSGKDSVGSRHAIWTFTRVR